MIPEQTTRRPAPPTAPAGTAPLDPQRIAFAMRFHLDAPGESPEARYFAATGRYPCDD